jgi:hypothetical protein
MWMVTFFGFIVCLIAAYLFGFWREQPATKDGFAIANYDVPHCDFTKTAEGFIVSFNQAKLGVHKGMADLSQPKGVGQAVGSLIGIAAIGAFRAAQGGTIVEVTRDAVIIDGKKMARRDFGNFHISHTLNGSPLADGSVAVLGYSFGRQSFEFGGAWPAHEANEVASALNSHLRLTPDAASEQRASPETLRAARPTDF